MTSIPALESLYHAFRIAELGMPGYYLVADSSFLLAEGRYLYEGEVVNPRFLMTDFYTHEKRLMDEFAAIADLRLLEQWGLDDPDLFEVRCMEIEELIDSLYCGASLYVSQQLSKARGLN